MSKRPSDRSKPVVHTKVMVPIKIKERSSASGDVDKAKAAGRRRPTRPMKSIKMKMMKMRTTMEKKVKRSPSRVKTLLIRTETGVSRQASQRSLPPPKSRLS